MGEARKQPTYAGDQHTHTPPPQFTGSDKPQISLQSTITSSPWNPECQHLIPSSSTRNGCPQTRPETCSVSALLPWHRANSHVLGFHQSPSRPPSSVSLPGIHMQGGLVRTSCQGSHCLGTEGQTGTSRNCPPDCWDISKCLQKPGLEVLILLKAK